MKKIIETDLVSIAHKILQLKDKSDVKELLTETERLYQKLVLLKFYEDNKFRLEKDITSEKLIEIYDDKENFEQSSDTFPLAFGTKQNIQFSSDYMSTDIIHELVEDSKNDDVVSVDEDLEQLQSVIEENLSTNTNEQISAINDEEVLPTVEVSENIERSAASPKTSTIQEEGLVDTKENQTQTLEIDPVFSLANEELFVSQENTKTETKTNNVLENQHFMNTTSSTVNEVPFHQVPINKTINDAFNNTIVVALNDRIAFEKNLFGGSSEDLNRVISQLNTLDSYQEAVDFIEDLVKPDFNQWKDKEEYEQRFMQLVQQRFL
ncbi:MAG TPA: hypothetical protein VKZ80_06920 [Flavobacterium sp.]|nr:hypothetical protein [Flavobacterium sp.]